MRLSFKLVVNIKVTLQGVARRNMQYLVGILLEQICLGDDPADWHPGASELHALLGENYFHKGLEKGLTRHRMSAEPDMQVTRAEEQGDMVS